VLNAVVLDGRLTVLKDRDGHEAGRLRTVADQERALYAVETTAKHTHEEL
jgi:hypothetical protein